MTSPSGKRQGRSPNSAKLREGAWYGVPLTGGGWGLVLVVRYSEKGNPLGYFFGPRQTELKVNHINKLLPGTAVMVRRFAQIAIKDGSWPLVCESPNWSRAAWPVPPFKREDILASDEAQSKRDWIIYYDDDAIEPVSEKRVRAGSIKGLADEGLAGQARAEKDLSQLLAARK